jgi:hypothetical protein
MYKNLWGIQIRENELEKKGLVAGIEAQIWHLSAMQRPLLAQEVPTMPMYNSTALVIQTG